jgi:hypothetical protein
VRQRYREASDVIKKGKLCSLFINDLDAGMFPLSNSHSAYRLCQNSECSTCGAPALVQPSMLTPGIPVIQVLAAWVMAPSIPSTTRW